MQTDFAELRTGSIVVQSDDQAVVLVSIAVGETKSASFTAWRDGKEFARARVEIGPVCAVVRAL